MTHAPLGVVLRHLRTLVDAETRAAETDGHLLARFTAHRDEAAFATLLRRHGPMVLAVCRRVLACLPDAEDVFQATFLLLARKAASIRKHESVGSWLHGVAYRLAVAAKTQARCRQVHERRAATMRKTETRPEATWQDIKAILDEGLQQLPEKYRTALVMSYLEGKSHEEAAAQLGCPLATFRNWVARGRKLLRKQLVGRGLSLSTAALVVALAEEAAPAAVPPTLLRPTLQSALQFATGTQATVLVSPAVAALVDCGLKAMLVARLKLGVAFLLTLGILTAAVGFGAHQTLFATPADEAIAQPAKQLVAEPAPRRTDAFGDPLPEGAIDRLGTLRFRHGGGVIDGLLFTPDGKTLISRSSYGSRTVCIWEFATGKLLRQFPGHWDENGAVALAPDGKVLAIGQDAVIHFYDLATGRQLWQLESPVGGTDGLAFSPDGRMLASGHQRQAVILWDLASTGGRELCRFPGELNRLTQLAFSADGQTLLVSDRLDSTFRLFDVTARKERQRLARATELFDRAFARGAYSFSPKGNTLAFGSKGGTVIQLLDVNTGKLIGQLRGAGKYIHAIAWSPDGKTVAASYYGFAKDTGAIHLWDAATGKERQPIKTGGEVIHCLAFTPDGQTLVSGGGSSVIRLWDLATGRERAPATPAVVPNADSNGPRPRDGLQASITCMAMAPNGRLLAYNGWNGNNIQLWDRQAGSDAGTISGNFSSLAFSPDGKTLAGVGNKIASWDVASRRQIRQFQSEPKREDGVPYDSFGHLTFSPNGKLLAGVGGLVRTQNRVNVPGERMVQVWEVATGKKLRRFSIKEGADNGGLHGVTFSADSKRLFASGLTVSLEGLAESNVRVWEVATGKPLPHLSAALSEAGDDVPAPSTFEAVPYVFPQIVLSPDGKLLAMNRSQKTIPIWDAATGKRRLVLEGHEEATVFVTFSPDSRTLASASWDNTIRLWDVATGKPLRKLTGHRGKAASLVFSPDGKTLISAGDDTTVMFWDVAAITGR
jgi:RNA polymerase sigma factor (sigma-70 family)